MTDFFNRTFIQTVGTIGGSAVAISNEINTAPHGLADYYHSGFNVVVGAIASAVVATLVKETVAFIKSKFNKN